jgi:RimJ/RimL family protein N-acetyltransferase
MSHQSVPYDSAPMTLLLPVTTKRLLLRRLAVSDLDAFHAYRNDPEIARYQSWNGITRRAAAAFLRGQARARLGVPGRWCQVGIDLTGELIGDVGVCIRKDERSAEVGFSLARAHQGRGYAWEAMVEVVGMLHLPGVSGVERIEAVTDARNLSAIRLLRRLGFTLERTVDNVFKGEGCQEHVFGFFR